MFPASNCIGVHTHIGDDVSREEAGKCGVFPCTVGGEDDDVLHITGYFRIADVMESPKKLVPRLKD